jgi:hypothetical protein
MVVLFESNQADSSTHVFILSSLHLKYILDCQDCEYRMNPPKKIMAPTWLLFRLKYASINSSSSCSQPLFCPCSQQIHIDEMQFAKEREKL